MVFSWDKSKQEAIDHKIRRNKTLAKSQHPDYKLKHPAEARDANQGKFTELITRTTKEITDAQELALQRRAKKIGK